MKRKLLNSQDEQSRSSLLLFNKSKDLVEKLRPIEYSDDDLDKKPVWIDEDDDQFQQTKVKRNTQYSEKLKEQYKSLMGTPSWAKLKDTKDIYDDDEMLRTVGHIKKNKPMELPKNALEIKKLPYINSETRNEGRIISCIEFHPKLSVALVGGNSGIVSLFSIGGDENKKLHSFQLENWKISSAQFTPSGSETYLSTKINHSYCVYDLIKAQPKLVQLPQIVKRAKIFELSPDGKFIAMSSGYDEIFLISTASKELVRTLKHNSNIESLTFSNNSEQLYCYSIEGEVTIWDLSIYRALKKFYDNGCVKASYITTSSCGKLLATGSCEGIVNIYETSKIDTMEPIPIKTITNLTSKITKLKFNPTTEILAASSAILPNAMKLIHLPSYQVFKNFPNQSQNFSQIESINFSPNSGYVAMGNNKGCGHLYRLKYYNNY